MKQARKLERGESRREVASTCGRNIARTWEPSQRVDAPGDVTKRDETLAGSLVPKGSGRELERRNSEEASKPEEMNLTVRSGDGWYPEYTRRAWKQGATVEGGEPNAPHWTSI